jgi:hypothetical protein
MCRKASRHLLPGASVSEILSKAYRLSLFPRGMYVAMHFAAAAQVLLRLEIAGIREQALGNSSRCGCKRVFLIPDP